MPNWKELEAEVGQLGTIYDITRRKYLSQLHQETGRNIIAYYSGWLQKPSCVDANFSEFIINDADKSAFMAVLKGLDKSKGLDLFLHTPGGDIAATESLVDYLRALFGTNIRAIIPQLALSAGSMVACACSSIVMGKHSSIGPIDPQLDGMPAQGILDEFDRARTEIVGNPSLINLWQPILSKYPPTLIGQCLKSVKWAEQIVRDWLDSGMFAPLGDAQRAGAVDKVISGLGHNTTLTHNRHISVQRAADLGLVVERLEEPGNETLQDLVLSVHHAYVMTLADTSTIKIVENHNGIAVASSAE